MPRKEPKPSEPDSNSASPTETPPIDIKSYNLSASFNINQPRIATKIGEEYCNKIAFAEVVSFVAATNVVKVAA